MSSFEAVVNELKQGRIEAKKGIDEDKAKLDELKKAIQDQGGKAELNAQFNKLSLAIQQRELDLKRETATDPAAQEELDKEQAAIDAKNNSLLSKISGGISSLFEFTKKGAEKFAGGGLGKILKGTLFAGFFLAIASFLNSPYFQQTVDFITTTIVPMLETLYKDYIKPFATMMLEKFLKFFEDLGSFLKDPSFETFTTLIGENKVALLSLAALLAPGLTLKVLRAGVMALKGGFVFLGTELMKDAKGMRFAKSRGMINKAKLLLMAGIGKVAPLLGVLKGGFVAISSVVTGTILPVLLPIAAIAATVGAAVYTISEAFTAFKTRLEETGSVTEAIKAGISSFLGTLIALPSTLLQKIVSFFAGLFGFDQFKEKIDAIDFAGAASKAIEDLINGVINFFKGIPEVVKNFYDKFIGPDAEWAVNVRKSITDFFDPIINFDFKKLLGDLLGKAGKIGSKIANYFGFGKGGEEKVEAPNKGEITMSDDLKKLGGLDKAIVNTRQQMERLMNTEAKNSRQARIMIAKFEMLEKRLAKLQESAIGRSVSDAASVNINAPSDNKVTNSTSNTTSNTTTISNPDPIVQMAFR